MGIIEVSGVTKEFKLGQLDALKVALRRAGGRLSGRPVSSKPLFKALNDVSFEVNAGEVVGIIGHNGAGKSTLLKILSRITVPTRGQVKVGGKVAPLIEVGAGLVGELTGRENIYLNGSILGMKRSEIRRRLDEIVAFAELEQFIDTPIKRYSSGMQIRLGFSIASSIEADILIVDEVLAVGDLAFQRKCFDRMEAMIKKEGKTVLVVGHNLRQLERLCSRIILLDHGQIVVDDAPAVACRAYIEATNRRAREYVEGERKQKTQIMKSDELDVDSVRVFAADEKSDEIPIGSPIRVGIELNVHRDLHGLEVVVGFHTPDFVYIASASTMTDAAKYSPTTGTHYLECEVGSLKLLPGVYAVRVSFLDRNSRPVWYGENLAFFTITSGQYAPSDLPVLGFVTMDVNWRQRGPAGSLVPLSV